MSILSFACYREVIHYFIKRNAGSRGYKAALAKAGKIQPSYFSSVLKMASELSLDQASSLADFWELSFLESEYFISLVIIDRSSSMNLKALYRQRLSEIRSQASQQKGFKESNICLADPKSLDYRSSWFFPAIVQFLGSAPSQSTEAIADRLNLHVRIVEDALNILLMMGLVDFNFGKWKRINQALLENGVKHLRYLHHSAMRSSALERMKTDNDGFHATRFLTLSTPGLVQIKGGLEEFYRNIEQLNQYEKGENAVSICMDFIEN